MKKKVLGFTLLEVIIAITSFFLLLTVIINIYTRMIKLKYSIQARTNITQDSYFAIEKINLLLKDYTIDYEEYFNRKNVWCDTYNDTFTRDVGIDGYCNLFTAYGNNNNIWWISPNERSIYFCSSYEENPVSPKIIKEPNLKNGSGCINTGQQSFGQYRRQFRDYTYKYAEAVGGETNANGEVIMKWPSAIEDAINAQELYLISQDGKSRIFIRRALIESGDRNRDGNISGDNEKLYTLQILKLRGFDAGNKHDFDASNGSGVYDGIIDTRACDYAQWFICNGSGISNLYSGYKLSQDENDGRVNLFQKNITISDRNLMVYPIKNPKYALAENNNQINPYFTINFTSKLYGQIRQKRLSQENIDNYQINLQTTFNTKNFYTK